MNNVRSLALTVNTFIADDIHEKVCYSAKPTCSIRYRNITGFHRKEMILLRVRMSLQVRAHSSEVKIAAS